MSYRSMLDNVFSSQRPLFSLSSRAWNPPTDIYETPELTVIRIEVAGLDEGLLNITAQGNILSVRGVRPQTQPGQDVCYHLMEVHHGPFERIFQFSFPISQDDIKAVYQKGFLIVEVRKQLHETRKVTVEIMQEIDGP